MTHIGTLLYEMAEREFSDLLEFLKSLPPEEIIRHSYEKTMKEDFLLILENKMDDFPDATLLIETEQPLDYLYNEWLGNDFSYLPLLEDTLYNTMSTLDRLHHNK